MKNKADRDLLKFLCGAREEVVFSLLALMDTHGQREISRRKRDVGDLSKVPPAHSVARQDLVVSLVSMLRYFGSHNAAYATRRAFGWMDVEPGVSYGEVLDDVIEFLHKQVKNSKPLPTVSSVADRERILCEDLLRLQFQGRSESEIAGTLLECGLSKRSALRSARQIGFLIARDASFLAVVHSLGTGAAKSVIERVLVLMLSSQIGAEAASHVGMQLLKRIGQKALGRLLGYVGWALLAWDVIRLAGPAKRVTVPCVVLIAAERTFGRIAP